MDSSRTKRLLLVYWLGIVLPVLVETALMLGERAGAKLSLGAAWIAIGSFAVCVIGAVLARTKIEKAVVLLAFAAIIIPVEYLILGAFLLTRNGLTGTQ